MGLLTGKNIVITGVLTDASLAYGVALLAQQDGANIVLTGAGRALSLTQRTARKLPQPVDVFELDVTQPDHLVAVRDGDGLVRQPTVAGQGAFIATADAIRLGWGGSNDDMGVFYLYDKGDRNVGYALKLLAD